MVTSRRALKTERARLLTRPRTRTAAYIAIAWTLHQLTIETKANFEPIRSITDCPLSGSDFTVPAVGSTGIADIPVAQIAPGAAIFKVIGLEFRESVGQRPFGVLRVEIVEPRGVAGEDARLERAVS